MTQHLNRESTAEEEEEEDEEQQQQQRRAQVSDGLETRRHGRRHAGFVVPTVQTHEIHRSHGHRHWSPDSSASKTPVADGKKRRSRSLSPTRRSPRIRHTQGRLHEEYEQERELYQLSQWTLNPPQSQPHRRPQQEHQQQQQQQLQQPQQQLRGAENASRNVTAWMERSSRRSHQPPMRPPTTPTTHRSVKRCGCSRPPASFEWIQIKYSDESLREKQQAKMNQLISCARNDPETSTRAILARKALKYRRVLSKNEDPSKADATFDFSKWNRIKWCKLQRVE